MEQTNINPAVIFTAVLLFEIILCTLAYGVYRLIIRVLRKYKRIIIEPANDNECSDL